MSEIPAPPEPGDATATPAPEPIVPPAPEPIVAPPAPAPAPPSGVAATLSLPPLEGAPAPDGGEWDLLTGKVRQWLDGLHLGEQWQRYRGGLKLLLWLVVLLVALRTYAAVVGTIDAIPVVSGLLELVGLIVASRFAVRRLLPRQERARTFNDLAARWRSFRGQA